MTDRTVLITGATAGIGEAAARAFAASISPDRPLMSTRCSCVVVAMGLGSCL